MGIVYTTKMLGFCPLYRASYCMAIQNVVLYNSRKMRYNYYRTFVIVILPKEVFRMATKSILKNITIKNAKQCRSLLKALEGSRKTNPKPVIYQRPVKTLNAADVKLLFGGADDGIQRS